MFIQDEGDIAGLIVYIKVLDDLDAVLHSAIDSGMGIYVGQDTDFGEALKDLAKGRRDKCNVLNQGAVGDFGLFHPHADAAVGLVDPDIDGLPESFALETANKVSQVGKTKRVGADKNGLDLPRTYALGEFCVGEVRCCAATRPTKELAFDDGIREVGAKAKIVRETTGGLIDEQLVVGRDPDVDGLFVVALAQFDLGDKFL
jgi:hypothetical protein